MFPVLAASSSFNKAHIDLSCIRTTFHDSIHHCSYHFILLLPPFHLTSGFSGQRRARATSASSTTLLPPSDWFVCGFFLFCSLARSALLPSFPSRLSSCSLLCLDFLTKDCQGFQLIVTLSFPPDCTFLPHCCVRRLIRLPCINLWVRAFLVYPISCQGA